MQLRYWLQRIDGVLWLMLGEYKVGVQAEAVQQLDDYLNRSPT